MHDIDEVNADLIGYTFEIGGAPFRVVGSDRVLGPNYVTLHRDGTDGSQHYDIRVQGAAVIRRRMQIEAATMQAKAAS